MPRSRFSEAPRDPAVFVDRHEHLHAISAEIFVLSRNPRHLRVAEVTGLGGVGKTRLMHRLREVSGESKKAPKLVWVSLESERMTGSEGPLLALREQFPQSCLLFDAVLVRLWTATGQPFQFKPDRITSSYVFKSLDATRAATKAFPVPLTFAVDTYRAATKKVTGWAQYTSAEFARVDAIAHDPEALRALLPHALGLDLSRRQDEPLVVFYDAYDRQSSATLAEGTVWLRELIASLGRGLHVIASREPLGWPEQDWDAAMLPIHVGELPDTEARQLIIERAPDAPLDVQDRLLLASARIPFFLEAALVAYQAQLETGAIVRANELPRTQEDSVAYLLKHLDPAEREAAIALAAVQRFDRDLFEALLKDLNIPVSVQAFDWFVGAFFTAEFAPGLHKTHDVLTAFVRSAGRYEAARKRALSAALRQLGPRIHARAGGPSEGDAALLGGLVTGWRSVDTIEPALVEQLVDTCYGLYDAGFWRELASIAVEVPPDDHPSAVIADYFAALATRRGEGVGAALARLEQLEPRASVLGRRRRSLDLEIAYLSELDGNYGRARDEFRRLHEAAEDLDPSDRNQVRAWLYHGDMLTMDGDLVEAARVLLEGAERIGASQPAVRLDFVRHRAHAYRFSFAEDRAVRLYLQAFDGTSNAAGMQAKLLTNLAETRCWFDPELALHDTATAIELHERLGNRLELAKCEAAGAIARAKLGKHGAAAEAAARALRHAQAVGYRAGEAFACQAAVFCACAQGDDDLAIARLSELRMAVKSIGTYEQLLVVALLAVGDEHGFANAFAKVRWLEPEKVKGRLRTAVLG